MRVNALRVRQAFGKIIERLQAVDEPIIIEKGRKPVAVLISIKAFEERFIDQQDREKQKAIIEMFRKSSVKPVINPLEVLRQLRYG